MRPFSSPFRLLCLLAAAAAGGCAHPTAPGPLPASDPNAEAARREERLKVMQEYWDDRTGAGPGAAPAREAGALLEYPAGVYAGINFAPRLAPDPSLAEPSR
jgi:hypothetical protein